MVFDDVNDVNVLRPLLPAGGRGQVVVTSTRQTAARLGRPVPVNVFSAEEAVRFMTEQTRLDDQEGAQELADELGRLPLALAQAASVIVQQALGYDTYLRRLRSVTIRRYLSPVEWDAYPRGVAQAALLSLDTIGAGDQPDVCSALMDLVSVLSAAGVSRVILQAAGRAEALLRVPGPVDEAGVDAALGRLAAGSLLTFSVSGSAVIAHRL